MGDYDVPDDYDGPPIPHRIVCRSGWYAEQGGCPGWHEKLWQVKECYEAKRDGAWPCTWVVRSLCEDGYYSHDCGRPTRYTDKDLGIYECARGHDFVPPQVRQAQGWDYAEDQGEAERLAKVGVEPRTMDGKVWS